MTRDPIGKGNLATRVHFSLAWFSLFNKHLLLCVTSHFLNLAVIKSSWFFTHSNVNLGMESKGNFISLSAPFAKDPFHLHWTTNFEKTFVQKAKKYDRAHSARVPCGQWSSNWAFTDNFGELHYMVFSLFFRRKGFIPSIMSKKYKLGLQGLCIVYWSKTSLI